MELVKNGKGFVKRFNSEEIIKKYLEVYYEAVKDN